MALGLPDCHEVSRRLASGELEDASSWTRLLSAVHLALCSHCRRFRNQLKLLRTAARLWAGGLLPADRAAFEARLIQRLSRS